jgi:hypothetical protein
MNVNASAWEKWRAPYDPRQMNGATVTEDEHGRMVETADCGLRCPGCGVCCQGYRDPITDDYQGVEEFDLNLKALGQRGRIVQLGGNYVYHGAQCGQGCPGYGQCCQPHDLRVHLISVKQAGEILLERDDSTLWEIQEALLLLAHEGTDEAVDVLEQYLPRAHARVGGFAECALEEGRYFNSVPRSDEERVCMLKREVMQQYEEQIYEAQAEIDENLIPEIERLEYELDVVRRVKEKEASKPDNLDWQTQLDVLEILIGTKNGRLEELRAEIQRNELVLAEIERDLGEGGNDTEGKSL